MTVEFYFTHAPTECHYAADTISIPRVGDTVVIRGETGVFQVVEVRWCYWLDPPNQTVKILLGPTYPTALDRAPQID